MERMRGERSGRGAQLKIRAKCKRVDEESLRSRGCLGSTALGGVGALGGQDLRRPVALPLRRARQAAFIQSPRIHQGAQTGPPLQ
eukprot:2948194-Amphidinium_carterae.1